jgi:hypothetical protein
LGKDLIEGAFLQRDLAHAPILVDTPPDKMFTDFRPPSKMNPESGIAQYLYTFYRINMFQQFEGWGILKRDNQAIRFYVVVEGFHAVRKNHSPVLDHLDIAAGSLYF